MDVSPCTTAMNHGPHVVMTGPLPPAIGGMATFMANLAQSPLRQHVVLEFFDTGKTTLVGRPLWQGVSARLRLLRRWWRLLDSHQTMIVHIHTCSGLTYFLDSILLLLARLHGYPTILHIHGGRFDVFLDRLPQPVRWVAETMAELADRVVVLSEEWRVKLASRLPSVPLYVVQNGVPQAIVAANIDRSRTQQVRLLFMGSLCTGKGCLELVQSMRGLPDKVHLSLVGGEEEAGYLRRLREEIIKLNLSDHVEMPGPSSGDAKWEYFGKADIFVLPSYAEGLPMALLEAMSAGLPVIATRVGGIPTAIEDGKQGILIEPGDIAALHAAILQLATDRDKRRVLGQAAHQRWQERFSIEHTVTALLALYSSLLATRHNLRS